MSLTMRYQLPDYVIHQTVANEAVIINLENGRYYSLNPTASVIWQELMRQANAQEIAQVFPTPENPEPAVMLPPITLFVNELIAEGLLTPAPADTPAAVSNHPVQHRVRFETPALEKFTDMQELIPLDPIHQVGTLGWPYRIQDTPEQGA